jgi:hypothetical protein
VLPMAKASSGGRSGRRSRHNPRRSARCWRCPKAVGTRVSRDHLGPSGRFTPCQSHALTAALDADRGAVVIELTCMAGRFSSHTMGKSLIRFYSFVHDVLLGRRASALRVTKTSHGSRSEKRLRAGCWKCCNCPPLPHPRSGVRVVRGRQAALCEVTLRPSGSANLTYSPHFRAGLGARKGALPCCHPDLHLFS